MSPSTPRHSSLTTALALWLALACGGSGSIVAQDGGVNGLDRVVGVLDLICICLEQRPGAPILLFWRNPEDARFDQLDVIVGGEQLPPQFLPPEAPLPGAEIDLIIPPEFLDMLPPRPPGEPLEIQVIAFEAGQPLEQRCFIDCREEVQQPPEVQVDPLLNPQRVCFPTDDPIEVIFDISRPERDSLQALEYFWRLENPDAGLVLDPRSSVCRVLLRPPPGGPIGTVNLQVRVLARPAPGAPASEIRVTVPVELLRADAEPEGVVPMLNPIHPIHRTILANSAADLVDGSFSHELAFQLSLSEGCRNARFELTERSERPAGLRFDPATGRLQWAPSIEQAGRIWVLQLRAVNEAGPSPEVEYLVRVLDSAVPVLLFDFTPLLLPPPGEFPPSPVYSDLTDVHTPLPLYLVLPPGTPECSVRQVIPEDILPAGERPLLTPGVLFEPLCEGVLGDGGIAGVSSTGGYYTSGTSALQVSKSITKEFTLEVWLSSMNDLQSGVTATRPAYIWSHSESTTGVNWLIGCEGDTDGDGLETYVFEVQLDGEATPRVASVEADFSDPVERQLVFVKDEDEHRFYVDGVEVAAARETGVPTTVDWDSTYQIYIGAAEGGSNPMTGTLHGYSIYSEALSDAAIAWLESIGSAIPGDAEVPPPSVAICPDPTLIGRVRGLSLDGGMTEAGIGLPGMGAPAGGGACDAWLDFLRPAVWSVQDSAGPVAALISPVTGFEECKERVEIDFPVPNDATFEVHLSVAQIALRGKERQSVVSPPIELSTDFIRGDSNCSGAVDVSDCVYLLQSLFDSGPAPCCTTGADANNDGALDVSDSSYLLGYLFLGGLAPPDPGVGVSGCGPDPLPHELGESFWCEAYPVCP